MEEFVKGEVLVVPFPFSDLSDFKKRPVLVIATPKGEDIIVCQITSQQRNDRYTVEITNSDFKSGSLNLKSFVRTQRIFTMDKKIVIYSAGMLNKDKIRQVENVIVHIFTGENSF